MARYADIVAVRDALYEADAITMKGVRILNQFPTLSPDEVRGVGRWVRISGYHLDHEYYPARYKCDQCGHFVDSGDDRNYCPNCGAKMEVREDA